MLIGQQELPQKIKDLRGDQSQAEFALRFQVTRQLVSQWENGDAVPSSTVLRELQIEKVFLMTSDSSKRPEPESLAEQNAQKNGFHGESDASAATVRRGRLANSTKSAAPLVASYVPPRFRKAKEQ